MLSPRKLPRIGVQIAEPDARSAIEAIVQAERLGITAAWMTLGAVRPDPLPIFAAAALRTERIGLGTSIIPTYPRHPFALAQAARVVGELAPGRFRLGIGPSHRPVIEQTWGLTFTRPLDHLAEYLRVVKAALQQGGKVQFQGEFFRVEADWGAPAGVPVLISALRRRSYELAGAQADGAISWVSPLAHIERVALPALAAGAQRAGRPRPPLVMQVGVAVHEDAAEVRAAARSQFSVYPRLPFYQRMFAEAGFAEALQGTLSDAMIDAIVIWGSEQQIVARLEQLAAVGVDEVLCSIVAAGDDPTRSRRRALELLGELSRA
ncbi:MAG TPA: LLM class flavin-dependent oxidoreductase [Bacillota bacterium]